MGSGASGGVSCVSCCPAAVTSRSLAATTSRSLPRDSTTRMKLRPMRPNPLIPIRMSAPICRRAPWSGCGRTDWSPFDATAGPEARQEGSAVRAAGVHAGPLAEFAILGLLAFAKGLPRLLDDRQTRRWEHYPMAELARTTVLVIGLGETRWLHRRGCHHVQPDDGSLWVHRSQSTVGVGGVNAGRGIREQPSQARVVSHA